jgi:hypothetical protein
LREQEGSGETIIITEKNMKFINEDDVNRMKMSVSEVQTNGNDTATKRVRKVFLSLQIPIANFLSI